MIKYFMNESLYLALCLRKGKLFFLHYMMSSHLHFKQIKVFTYEV